MTKISTYRTKCRKCNCEAYYYPAKLLLESSEVDEKEDLTVRVVTCSCTGEKDGKHSLEYLFPSDFQKI